MRFQNNVKLDPPMETSQYPLLKDAPVETFGIALDQSGGDSWTVYINHRGDVVFIEDLDVFPYDSARLNEADFRFKAIPRETKITATWGENVED